MILSRCLDIPLIVFISMKKNCWFNNNYFLFNIIKKRTISRLHVSKQGDAGHNHDHFMGWKIPQAFGDCIHGYEHVSVCWWSPKNHPNALQHVRSISNFLYRFEYFEIIFSLSWPNVKNLQKQSFESANARAEKYTS